jgi:hypothetical protein
VIYVDAIQTYKSGEWCHMWSATGDTDELHAFAKKIGLRRDWAQVSSSRIVKEWHHYDLRPTKRVIALKHGAVEMSLLVWLKEQQATSVAAKHCTVCKISEEDAGAKLIQQNDGALWCVSCCYAAADFNEDELCQVCEGGGCDHCEGTGLDRYEEPYYPPRNI